MVYKGKSIYKWMRTGGSSILGTPRSGFVKECEVMATSVAGK
jgi:hypothetical protein